MNNSEPKQRPQPLNDHNRARMRQMADLIHRMANEMLNAGRIGIVGVKATIAKGRIGTIKQIVEQDDNP